MCELILKYELNSKENRQKKASFLSISMSLYLITVINVNREDNTIDIKDTSTSIFNIDNSPIKKFVGIIESLFIINSGVKL